MLLYGTNGSSILSFVKVGSKNIHFFALRFFICRVLSLCRAKAMCLHCVSTRCRAGWSGLIRIMIGRLSEVGSSMSWVRCLLLGFCRI